MALSKQYSWSTYHEQVKKTCSAIPLSLWHSGHATSILWPHLNRYALQRPWPVSNCVRQKFTCPLFLLVQSPMLCMSLYFHVPLHHPLIEQGSKNLFPSLFVVSSSLRPLLFSGAPCPTITTVASVEGELRSSVHPFTMTPFKLDNVDKIAQLYTFYLTQW